MVKISDRKVDLYVNVQGDSPDAAVRVYQGQFSNYRGGRCCVLELFFERLYGGIRSLKKGPGLRREQHSVQIFLSARLALAYCLTCCHVSNLLYPGLLSYMLFWPVARLYFVPPPARLTVSPPGLLASVDPCIFYLITDQQSGFTLVAWTVTPHSYTEITVAAIGFMRYLITREGRRLFGGTIGPGNACTKKHETAPPIHMLVEQFVGWCRGILMPRERLDLRRLIYLKGGS